MADSVDREMGRMDTEIRYLRQDMDQVKADVSAIRDILSQARGGWRALMIVAGVAGATGAVLTKLASWVGVLTK